MNLGWLKSPLMCNGQAILPPLDPAALTDRDLPDICIRMHLVLGNIEQLRCEGRLINIEIFDPIDTLLSHLVHKERERLDEWTDTITKFGEYYGLDGSAPIELTHPDALAEFDRLCKLLHE